MSKVAIIMGSDSDYEVMQQAGKVLEEFNIEYDIFVASAHRTPMDVFEYVSKARSNGFSVIIAGAGGAAHLPGVCAAYTTLPVIGVPIQTKSLGGLDSLLSIVQMPPGVPVATVAINGAKNAGILAVQMLSLADKSLESALDEYKLKIAQESRNKNNDPKFRKSVF
ncbi:MAG: N5-carboxyaminoimidazole ribonucleotide mutase [Candidatus Kapaibacterium sp.]|nr:MAG: N5-carboxyaminoimidazole ribonucleotide mutase [Candidatus Kapabacteria bacterium]ROL58594.1 MAG: 5-(carboxyamino)imidazole ribonucleotide mutase [Bacteroidetes/Chlorobi group bacterium Naka2016]